MSEELRLDRLLKAIVWKSWIVAISSVGCAVLAGLVSILVLTPRYQSSVLFYLRSNSSSGITSSEQSAAQNLTESSIVLLNTRETLVAVMEEGGLQLELDTLQEMLQAEMVGQTEFLRVTVTDTDPERAERLAAAVGTVLPIRLSQLLPGVSMSVAEAPVQADRASLPNHLRNTILGFLLGLVLSCCTVLGVVIFDRKLRCEADVCAACEFPVLAVIPDLEPKQRSRPCTESAVLQAYAALRTKLCVQLRDQGHCYVMGLVGICSEQEDQAAMIRLAQAFSRSGQRVLLIRCDMRENLPGDKFPGLAGYLSGRCDLRPAIRTYRSQREEDEFDMIFSGRSDEDTAALLSSEKMSELILQLRSDYDKIFLAFPPMGKVCDAAASVPLIDGMVLITQQNRTDRKDFASAVQQLKFARADILGVIFRSEPPRFNKPSKREPEDGYLQEVDQRMKTRIGSGLGKGR